MYLHLAALRTTSCIGGGARDNGVPWRGAAWAKGIDGVGAQRLAAGGDVVARRGIMVWLFHGGIIYLTRIGINGWRSVQRIGGTTMVTGNIIFRQRWRGGDMRTRVGVT
jgi:hypothetical protein